MVLLERLVVVVVLESQVVATEILVVDIERDREAWEIGATCWIHIEVEREEAGPLASVVQFDDA